MCSSTAEPVRRLFFALWPDDETRNTIDTLARGLIRQQARRVAADNLHITLAFPGNVTARVQACLEAAAGRLTGEPFELAIDRLGYWPGPRIIWAAPSETPAALWFLAAALLLLVTETAIRPTTKGGQ